MRTTRRFLPVAAGLLALAAVVAGCASTGARSATGSTLPTATTTTTIAVPATGCPPGVAAATSGTGAALTSAALLDAVVRVDRQPAAAPSCARLMPGEQPVVHVGDRLVFEANSAPQIHPDAPQVLSVSTVPLPPTSGPGQIPTAHVTVTLTAISPGTVKVVWEDCSGTGC